MASSYDLPFQSLREQISTYSPSTVPILDDLLEQSCPQTAYFAAFIFVCLHANAEYHHNKPLSALTVHDFKDFAFFDHAKDDQRAVALFEAALLAFTNDHEPD